MYWQLCYLVGKSPSLSLGPLPAGLNQITPRGLVFGLLLDNTGQGVLLLKKRLGLLGDAGRGSFQLIYGYPHVLFGDCLHICEVMQGSQPVDLPTAVQGRVPDTCVSVNSGAFET